MACTVQHVCQEGSLGTEQHIWEEGSPGTLLSDISLYVCRRHLSLELSLGIVFFTNIVLSLAALIYIVTGINTDLFVWLKDYIISLKDDDSAVNAKVSLLPYSA